MRRTRRSSARPQNEDSGGTTLRGLDVSNHQGRIDWAAVAGAGATWAAIKATEGTTFQDSRFGENLEATVRHGLEAVPYHFARPDLRTDPNAEAAAFLDQVTARGMPTPAVIALDVEAINRVLPTTLRGWVVNWIHHVDDAMTATPVIYASRSVAEVLARAAWNRRPPLWLADPLVPIRHRLTDDLPPAPVAAPWRLWGWQWSWHGQVPGISGAVDLDARLS